MFSPPIQPSRAPSRRPKFALKYMFATDFSSDIPYSTKLSVSNVSTGVWLIVKSPPLSKIITYFACSAPNQLLAMCFIARISGDMSNILNASFCKISPDADV